MYRDFEEQRRGYQQLKEKNADMYEKLTRFMENTRQVPEAYTTPIIADQHFGVSDMSEFQSYQGAPYAFNTLPDTSNWQNQMLSRRQDVGILDSNLCDRARREPQPSVYMLSILQLVLLGFEDRRHVPNWILRLANDRKGQLPVHRLVPDETEARSRWWVSSRAYFDGRSFEEEQIPRQLNRNNYFEVPSEMYRDFEEQIRGYQQMKEKNADMYKKLTRFMEDMRRIRGYQQMKEKNADMYKKLTRFMEDMRRVPEAHTTPIIADQHFDVSDMSGFQSYQGAPSSFNTLANNISYFNMPTPSNLPTPNQSNWLSPSNWQTPNQSYLGTLNS
nr:hypothetical protein [Tanacetum cinerariifolium]